MIGTLVQDSVALAFLRIALIPSVELIVDRLLIGIRLPNNSGIISGSSTRIRVLTDVPFLRY